MQIRSTACDLVAFKVLNQSNITCEDVDKCANDFNEDRALDATSGVGCEGDKQFQRLYDLFFLIYETKLNAGDKSFDD